MADEGDDGRERGGEHDLWSDAWSHVARPDEDALIPRDLWSPAKRRASTWHPPADGRPPRKHAEIGGRDSHLTFEPPATRRAADRPRSAARQRTKPPHASGPGSAERLAALPRAVRARRHAPDPSRVGARSMAPRDTVVGYRRHRGPGGTALLVLLGVAIALALAVLAWWLMTRPASVALAITPNDAVITVPGRGVFRGGLTLERLEPGTVTAVVSRTGYDTATVTVDVPRGAAIRRTVALKPRPFAVSVSTRPEAAAVTLTRADGSTVRGVSPCSLVTTAGPVTITIVQPGSNTFRQTLFVDATRTVDVLLDPSGQLVHSLGSLPAKGAPKSVAVTPDGREAWATILNGPPSIEVYDLKAMREVAGIDIGKYGAVEIIFNRAGTRAYASQMETAKVFEIDTATRKVLRSFDTKSAWTKVVALSPDEKTLYAANWSGNDVSVINVTTGKLVTRVPVAKTPRGLWPTADGRYLYVAGFAAGDLERVDLTTWDVKKVFRSGGALRHLVADERTARLYASDMAKNAVWVTDMHTLKTRLFAKTDQKPNTIKLSPDGRVLFVSDRGANNPKSYYLKGFEWGSILLFSTSDGKPLDAIVGGNQCTALDVSADGHTLVFSDFLDDRLRVYGVPAYDVLAKGNGGLFAAHSKMLAKAHAWE